MILLACGDRDYTDRDAGVLVWEPYKQSPAVPAKE